ncbi:hypothetical protein HK102_001444 [Quaeritorhiza haematococci]|nr:hypothetical protein HK102_001444 [Quaeritorhiza haematococci]
MNQDTQPAESWASRLRQRPRKTSMPEYVLSTPVRKQSRRAKNGQSKGKEMDAMDMSQEGQLTDVNTSGYTVAPPSSDQQCQPEPMSVDDGSQQQNVGSSQATVFRKSVDDLDTPATDEAPGKHSRKGKAASKTGEEVTASDLVEGAITGSVPCNSHVQNDQNDNSDGLAEASSSSSSSTRRTRKRAKTTAEVEQQEAATTQTEPDPTNVNPQSRSRRSKGKGKATDQTTTFQLVPTSAHIAHLPPELINRILTYLSSGSHNMTSMGRLALTCRPLLTIVSSHRFWQDVASTAGLPAPNPRSKKRDTWMKVVVAQYWRICLECQGLAARRSVLMGATMGDGSHGHVCWRCFKALWRVYEEEEEGDSDGEEDAGRNQITKGRAMSEYRLTEDMISLLDCRYVRNPHYKSAAPMNLFKLADVISLAYFVHGGKEGLKRAKQAKIDQAQEKQRKAEERIQQHKDHIISLLAARNVPAAAADNHRFSRYIQSGEIYWGQSIEQWIEAEEKIQRRKDLIVSLLAARKLPATTADGDRFTKYIQNGEVPEGKSPQHLVEAEHQEAISNALKAQRREEFRKCIEVLGVPWPDHPENLKFAEEYATYGTDLDELVALEKAQYDREQIEKARRVEYVSRAEELGIFLGNGMNTLRASDRDSCHLKSYVATGTDLETHMERERLDRVRRGTQTSDQRRTELVQALQSRGLKLRDDSALCKQYIWHGYANGRTLEQVVNVMVEMDWYFRCSEYRATHSTLHSREEVEFLYQGGFGVTKQQSSERRKLIALQRWVRERVSRGVWWSPRNDVVKEGDRIRPPDTLWGPIEEILGQQFRNSVEQNLAAFLHFYSTTNATLGDGAQRTEPTVEQFSNWLDTAWRERSKSAAAISSSSTSSAAAALGPESPNPSDLTFSQVLRSLNPDIDRAIRRKIRMELAIASAVASSGSASAATSALDPAPANAFTSVSHDQCGSG